MTDHGAQLRRTTHRVEPDHPRRQPDVLVGDIPVDDPGIAPGWPVPCGVPSPKSHTIGPRADHVSANLLRSCTTCPTLTVVGTTASTISGGLASKAVV